MPWQKLYAVSYDKAGFTQTKIHMADASYMFLPLGIDRARAWQKDPAAWQAIDYSATHEYDFQEFIANPDLYDARMKAMHEAAGGKPFLATEICVNDPHYQEPSYRIAFAVAQLYHKNLTEARRWLRRTARRCSTWNSPILPARVRCSRPTAHADGSRYPPATSCACWAPGAGTS